MAKLANVPSAAESTRERLFATAGELFRTKGFAATTTREIAAALGIQKATLYHHIRRKEDLLYEMCRASLARMHEAADRALEAEQTDPVERLRRLIESHMVAALHDRNQHATMLTELRSLPAAERDEILALRQDYELRLEQAIAAAQDAGGLRGDISAKDLRLALLNMLNWTIFWFRPEGEHTPEELGRLYAKIFVEGGAPGRVSSAATRRC